MLAMQARIREGAARAAMPNEKGEGEAERRMRELYEERLREYGELAAVEDEMGDDARYLRCSFCWRWTWILAPHLHLFQPSPSLFLTKISDKRLFTWGGYCRLSCGVVVNKFL